MVAGSVVRAPAAVVHGSSYGGLGGAVSGVDFYLLEVEQVRPVVAVEEVTEGCGEDGWGGGGGVGRGGVVGGGFGVLEVGC